MRDTIYNIKHPDFMLFDLDSTLLNTYGKQEGEAFNFHYQAHGYHPLLCFDGMTGDLLKAELRDGTQYCSKGFGDFMIPLMKEFRLKHPSLVQYLRGDSGFAAPELYEACEANGCKYAIRLKENATLRKPASAKDEVLTRLCRCLWGVLLSGRHLVACKKSSLQDREADEPVCSYVHVRCHNDGNRAIQRNLVLLRTREDGKFHQRSQKRFRLCLRQQSFPCRKC